MPSKKNNKINDLTRPVSNPVKRGIWFFKTPIWPVNVGKIISLILLSYQKIRSGTNEVDIYNSHYKNCTCKQYVTYSSQKI